MDIKNMVNNGYRTGDLVHCCNCENDMIVNIGLENCPLCGQPCLMWIDEDMQEVEV